LTFIFNLPKSELGMIKINLMKGDCLERMKEIPDKSVDMVLTDPPYGTTDAKWDLIIDPLAMWRELKRITKDNAAILLFGVEPFMSKIRMSNLKDYRYDWVWQKDKASNFLFANKQPGKVTEYCATFYRKQPQYNSQKTINPKGPSRRHLAANNGQGHALSTHLMKNKPHHRAVGKSYEPDKLLGKNLIYFAREQRSKLHPTQKPIALMEHLIRAYTREGETVLDFTMGSGSTGVACKNLNRNFIGIERDEKYFEIAKERIDKA
jgi:DNA modification methylase